MPGGIQVKRSRYQTRGGFSRTDSQEEVGM